MRGWERFLAEPRGVQGIYGAHVPPLECLELLLVSLEGTFELDGLPIPTSLPPRWTSKGFDRVQLRLNVGVRRMTLAGLLPARVAVTVESTGPLTVDLIVEGEGFEARVAGSSLLMAHVRPYRIAEGRPTSW